MSTAHPTPSDHYLIERAVRNAGRDGPRAARWAHVARALSCGSTVARPLCARFGLDPDEEIPAKTPAKKEQ